MDIDHAIRQIQEAQDLPPFSNIIIDLIRLVSALDDDLSRLRLHVQDLERLHVAPVLPFQLPETR